MRQLIAVALLYIVFVGLPEGITIPTPTPATPDRPVVPMPNAALREQVAPIAAILKDAVYIDRAIFAELWLRCADVIDGEDDSVEVHFENTLGLRLYTASVANIAWNRLANATGKYRGLDAAIEDAFMQTIGTDVKPVSDDLLRDYSELCRALAWAGTPTDQ